MVEIEKVRCVVCNHNRADYLWDGVPFCGFCHTAGCDLLPVVGEGEPGEPNLDKIVEILQAREFTEESVGVRLPKPNGG